MLQARLLFEAGKTTIIHQIHVRESQSFAAPLFRLIGTAQKLCGSKCQNYSAYD